MAYKDLYNFSGTMKSMPFKEATKGAIDPLYIESDISSAQGSYLPNSRLPIKYQKTMYSGASNFNYLASGEPTIHNYVMPQCTVVSGIDWNTVKTETNKSMLGIMDEYGITADGERFISVDYNGDPVSINSDNSRYGYPPTLTGLFTICTGGKGDQVDSYTSVDVGQEVINPMTGDYVNAGDTYTRTDNIPMGVVLKSVMKDERGRYLNHEQADDIGYSIVQKARLKIPFVKDDGTFNFANKGIGYQAVSPNHQYLYWSSKGDYAADRYTANIISEFVQSDENGKITIWDTDSDAYTNLPPTTAQMKQKIGTVEALDSRFPKANEDMVDTWPGSENTGTDTEGIPQYLYKFVKAVLRANGIVTSSTTERTLIRQYIQNGYFGYAHVNINIGDR